MTRISRRTFIKHMAVGGGSLAWMCMSIKFAHAAGPETYRVRIIHTNDHHARIEPEAGGVGGLEMLSAHRRSTGGGTGALRYDETRRRRHP